MVVHRCTIHQVVHRCTIHQEDGTLVAADVQLYLEEIERDGVGEWYGTISVTESISLVTGHRYRCILDDGRTGEFLVRRNTSAGGADRAAAFRGTGALR